MLTSYSARTAQQGAGVRRAKQQHERSVAIRDVEHQQDIRLHAIPAFPAWARKHALCHEAHANGNATSTGKQASLPVVVLEEKVL